MPEEKDYIAAARMAHDVGMAIVSRESIERNAHIYKLCLHALHDLRMLGVPIEDMIDMKPEILAAVDEYGREATTYT